MREWETMRIVFCNHTGQVSGAEKMLLLGLANLPRDRCELALVCPDSGQLRAAAERLDIPVHTSRAIHARFTYNPLLLARYAASVVHSLWDLRKIFRSLSPEIIHANTVRAGIVSTIATTGTKVKVIWHNHDMLPRHPITLAIRLLAYSSHRLHVVGCSSAAAQTLRPLRQTSVGPTVIHNGCESHRSVFDTAAREAKRAELGLTPSEFAIGIVGQITPRKGQLELIRAFSAVQAQIPNAVLLICGAPLFNKDEQYLSLLRREAERLHADGRIRFLGQRRDALEVVGAMDLSVLNSKREPFALTLIEAMMMGTPVISTACGGPTEMIEHGVQGEIVPVGDRDALVEAIVRLATEKELRRRYAAAARAMAIEKYSKEKYIAAWCSFYEEIGNSARAGRQSSPAAVPQFQSQEGSGL